MYILRPLLLLLVFGWSRSGCHQSNFCLARILCISETVCSFHQSKFHLHYAIVSLIQLLLTLKHFNRNGTICCDSSCAVSTWMVAVHNLISGRQLTLRALRWVRRFPPMPTICPSSLPEPVLTFMSNLRSCYKYMHWAAYE